MFRNDVDGRLEALKLLRVLQVDHVQLPSIGGYAMSPLITSEMVWTAICEAAAELSSPEPPPQMPEEVAEVTRVVAAKLTAMLEVDWSI